MTIRIELNYTCIEFLIINLKRSLNEGLLLLNFIANLTLIILTMKVNFMNFIFLQINLCVLILHFLIYNQNCAMRAHFNNLFCLSNNSYYFCNNYSLLHLTRFHLTDLAKYIFRLSSMCTCFL